MNKPSSRWWGHVSTREFSQPDLSQVVGILPIGAMALAPEETRVLAPPAPPIGKSNEHYPFPGGLSLRFDLLAKVWFETAKSAWRAGLRKIVLFHSHGGQITVIDIVCRALRVELGMSAVGASWFRTIESDDLFSARHRVYLIAACSRARRKCGRVFR